jgi:glycosyltransferase involved in cell wall biosynthesis
LGHSLAIVGPLPPPFGGVGVHMQRFLPYLDRAGVDYILYNTSGPTEIRGRAVSVAARKHRWFLRFLLFGAEPAVYIVGDQWPLWAASWFLSRVRGKRVVIALHGEGLRDAWESHGRLIRRCIARGLEAAARIIAVHQHIADFLEQVGDFRSKTIVAPAFIPPGSYSEGRYPLPKTVRAFCAEHSPVLLATGAPVLWQGTTDLYGIDMAVELVDRLRKRHPRVGLVWFLLDFIGSVSEYAEKMRREVTRRGLDGHWHFSPPVERFHTAFGLADVFVRPTCTDGDAVSIREALHFGLPVVTSDAVPRPDGVNLFRSRDQEDFERVVCRTLENLPAERERLGGRPSTCAADRVIELLQDVLKEAGAVAQRPGS